MSRPGLTYQDVANAADALQAQSINPTIEAIRKITGTGSNGTIAPHLRRWKEARLNISKIAFKDNLPEQLILIMKDLWREVITQSETQLASIEESYQKSMEEIQLELEKYKNNNQRWQKLFNQWQQEKAQLANEKLSLEQALTFAHNENNSIHAKYDASLLQSHGKQERIDELHRLHKQAQENLEHYRESAREQRLIDQQQFDQQKQQLRAELKYSQEQHFIQRENFSALQQENNLLKQSSEKLERNHSEKNLLIDQIKCELLESEKISHQHLQESQHWENFYKKIQELLNDKSTQLEKAQIENMVFKKQIENNQNDFIDLKEQLKLLNQEKWELAQEKSHLEGQLKQLQNSLPA